MSCSSNLTELEIKKERCADDAPKSMLYFSERKKTVHLCIIISLARTWRVHNIFNQRTKYLLCALLCILTGILAILATLANGLFLFRDFWGDG